MLDALWIWNESLIARDHGVIAIARSPDGAKIKQKMLFASSKDALRRALVGVAVEIQGSESSEVSMETGQYTFLLRRMPHRVLNMILLRACVYSFGEGVARQLNPPDHLHFFAIHLKHRRRSPLSIFSRSSCCRITYQSQGWCSGGWARLEIKARRYIIHNEMKRM